MIDAIQGMNEGDREIRGRVIDGADAPTVVLTRVYSGPVEEVWDPAEARTAAANAVAFYTGMPSASSSAP